MPRYIDVDKAKELWNGEHPTQIAMRRIFDDLPTADVVPKSEYDNLKMQFDALDCECDRLEKAESEKHDKIIEVKAEVAREIFEEIGERLSIVEGHRGLYTISEADITELKKKYPEREGGAE